MSYFSVVSLSLLDLGVSPYSGAVFHLSKCFCFLFGQLRVFIVTDAKPNLCFSKHLKRSIFENHFLETALFLGCLLLKKRVSIIAVEMIQIVIWGSR